jgi:hypothetical protein
MSIFLPLLYQHGGYPLFYVPEWRVYCYNCAFERVGACEIRLGVAWGVIGTGLGGEHGRLDKKTNRSSRFFAEPVALAWHQEVLDSFDSQDTLSVVHALQLTHTAHQSLL